MRREREKRVDGRSDNRWCEQLMLFYFVVCCCMFVGGGGAGFGLVDRRVPGGSWFSCWRVEPGRCCRESVDSGGGFVGETRVRSAVLLCVSVGVVRDNFLLVELWLIHPFCTYVQYKI